LHGPLIVSGFLGTLIGLERAIALSAFRLASRPDQSSLLTTVGNSWTYLGPILTALGALVLIIGLPGLAWPPVNDAGKPGAGRRLRTDYLLADDSLHHYDGLKGRTLGCG